MGLPLRIRNLRLDTATESAQYDFADGATAVVGPIGCGKSSMLELIKYSLGGSAAIMPAVRDNVLRVTCRVLVGNEELTLSRAMNSKTVEVIDPRTGEPISVWATTNRRNMPKASQELLRALGLPPDLRVPRRRTRLSAETVPVSFFDLFRYLYLSQNGIDMAVIGHNDPNLDNKRRAVFELLYGLVDLEVIELRTRRGKMTQDLDGLRADIRAIRNFLTINDQPEISVLDRREYEARQRLAEAETSLTQIRQEGLRIEEGVSAAKDRLSASRDRVFEAEERRRQLSAEVVRGRSIRAQLDLDETALHREQVATASLTGLEFVVCPRCAQSIRNRQVEPGHCLLCTQAQEEPEHVILDGELARLRSQRRDTEELMIEDESLLAVAEADLADAQTGLTVTMREFEALIRDPGDPLIEAVERAASEAAVARSLLTEIEAARARWANYQSQEAEALRIESVITELTRQQKQLERDILDRSDRIDRLSETFNDIVGRLKLPWYETARIDPNSYLPIVNNEIFDDLSVGGARKTIVNLAYHLANLTYSLADPVVLLPSLLIIDSPRKNVGQNEEDRAVTGAIYDRIRTLVDAYPGQFQLIIVDNDLPQDATKWLRRIDLDYEHPLVPGVGHPGETVETIASLGQISE